MRFTVSEKINKILESNTNDILENSNQASSYLKSIGFVRGSKVRGVSSAYYYIGENCGLIVYKSGIVYPLKYGNISKDIIYTDYTLRSTLPALGLSLQNHDFDVSEYSRREIVALSLLNKKKDTLFYPISKEELNSIIQNIQEDGKKIRKIVDDYFSSISTNESKMYIMEKEDRDSVIVKVGNKWRILRKNRKDYWDAEYKTKKDAQAALRAYWANKRECKRYFLSFRHKTNEGFFKNWNSGFLAKLTSFLITIFGPTVYFDHPTDNTIELFYKGEEKAELIYNPFNQEIVIMPEDKSLSPVSFYDTSEYEIKDYLSDLLLGELDESENSDYLED